MWNFSINKTQFLDVSLHYCTIIITSWISSQTIIWKPAGQVKCFQANRALVCLVFEFWSRSHTVPMIHRNWLITKSLKLLSMNINRMFIINVLCAQTIAMPRSSFLLFYISRSHTDFFCPLAFPGVVYFGRNKNFADKIYWLACS